MNKRLEIKNENKELNAKRCFKLINGKPIGFNKEDMINLNKFIEGGNRFGKNLNTNERLNKVS